MPERYERGRQAVSGESPIHKPRVTRDTPAIRRGIEKMSPWRGLAARLREREQSALEELYNLTSGRAFGLAYRVLDDGPAAEDVVQDAFLWVWDNSGRIDPDRGSVESLLLTIVHRRAIDALRKRARRAALTAEPVDDALDAGARDLAESVMESIDIEKVGRALKHLNPDQRAVIELAYFEGLTHTEVAARVAIPVGTVKSRMRLGMAALRQALGLGAAPSGGAEDEATSCEEIDDLIPAYVLGSATPEERRAVAQHLAGCELHDDLVPARAAALLLAHAAPEMPAAVGLKSRILAAAGRGRGAGGDGVGVGGPTARSNWGRKSIGAYGVAAAMAIALGAMVIWNVILQTSPEPERFVHYYRGNEGDWLRVETFLGEQGAEVSLGGLEPLGGAARYHLWTTRGEDVMFVGVFNTNPEGQWAGEFPFVFEAEDRLWITAQSPDDGSGPVGDAVMRTRF